MKTPSLKSLASEEFKKSFRKTLPQISMVASVIIGLILLMWGFAWRPDGQLDVEFLTKPWAGYVFLETGRILLAGGFLAMFLRWLQIMQVMETALERFMLSEGFIKLVADFEDIWSRITARLYLKGASIEDNNALIESVQKTVREQLYYDKNYYLQNLVQNFRVELSEDGKIITVENRQNYEIVALDQTPIELHFRFKARENEDLNLYSVSEEQMQFSIEETGQVYNCEVTESRDSSNNMITRTRKLAGHRMYRVERLRTESWELDRDPFYEIISRTVCDGFEFRCTVPSNTLRSSFIEFGVGDRFVNQMLEKEQYDRPGDISRKLSGIMLPHNGFVVYFERNTAR